MSRKVVIQKVDMDTALTAYLLEVSRNDEIAVVRDKATPEDLANPEVVCIECGGSGQTDRGNFDHHDTDEDLPPACVQAFQARFSGDRWEFRTLDKWGRNMSLLEMQLVHSICPELAGEPGEARVAVQTAIHRLVEYVSLLDTQGPEALKQRSNLPQGAFPTLSDIFSGMLLITNNPKEQLLRGIEICATLLEQRIDPFGLMPELVEWKGYIEAKRKNNEAIKKAIANAQFFETKSRLKAGFVETDVIGALGALYNLGCQIAVAYSPRFGNPPVSKYTIAGNGVRVDSLLKILNELEPGWGGPAHGTILGSPRVGSKLEPREILGLVKENL